MSKNLGWCRSRRAPGCGAGQFRRFARDVGVDGDRGPSAGRDGLHHGGRAGLAVASGEDALLAGEQRQLVGLDGAPGGEGADLGQIVCVDLLAEGQDDRVGGHCELRPGDRLRSPPAAVVRLTQDHLLADHLEDPAVLLRDRDR